ncbi:hypothetical protein U9M48_000111 [Paspalum notatum var. saurae]|uniref:Uncharacterized protein n=1 Tax=Paspalum notatum var. saurae TaxID=547442 RepID=A0AAQ3SFR4_PASNO
MRRERKEAARRRSRGEEEGLTSRAGLAGARGSARLGLGWAAVVRWAEGEEGFCRHMIDLALKWCLMLLVGAPLLLLLWGVLSGLLLLLPPLRAVVGEVPTVATLVAVTNHGNSSLILGRHMVASESLTELSPGEALSVLLTVRLPPVQSCTSKLSCYIQDPLLIIALRNVKLSLHCMEPVICLKRISRMGESRWMSLHKVSTSVPLLRLRIGLNILQSLYCIVESSHHLHLKLKRLICCQRRWVLRWVLRWVAISLIPGVYHLLAAVETISVSNCCTYPG